MKRILLTTAFLSLITIGFAQERKDVNKKSVEITIDLVNVLEDKVKVTIFSPEITSNEIEFCFPKIVPGTYSEDNYGKMIENLKAYDKKGKVLKIAKFDDNIYTIYEAKKLDKLVYYVNDTYDQEEGKGFMKDEEIFSPAGSNILANKNFVLNNHAFVGYFKDKVDLPYQLTVLHPKELFGATSMEDANVSETEDVFYTNRYATLVDHPIMYSKPNFTKFNVEGMEILIAVYSPTDRFKVEDIAEQTKVFMSAQKKFLGKFNSNKKYAVLLYLSDIQAKDAKGFGALEHTTSTVMVMPEMMETEELNEQLKDVVSHEFFHIVTPLSVHSREIHNFNFNEPNMSKHLWMYEGVTEYFANLFQINQGLITEENFYERLVKKIMQASTMNDKMSFTKMSKNVLNQPYKDQYVNVYEKGALIAMCLDVKLRELSGGKRGILSLMQELSATFGADKPFNDDELFPTILKLTYPEIGKFIETHIEGETPISYEDFFKIMGVAKVKIEKPTIPFLKDKQIPLITVNPNTKEIVVLPTAEKEVFFNSLGIKDEDIILEINGTKYNQENIYDLVIGSQNWKIDDEMTVKVKRGGEEKNLKAKIKLPTETFESYQSTKSNSDLRESWLRG